MAVYRLSLRTPMRHTIAVGTAGCGGRGKLGVEIQRCGLRWGNGTFVLLASSARRAAASSLGGGGPVSLLARALRMGSGIVSALAGTGGSKPPAVSTVPHSR